MSFKFYRGLSLINKQEKVFAFKLKSFLFGLRLSLLELLRQPSYVVTTMIFPSMFFWFFGIPNAKTLESAKLLVGSFSAFAVLGVVLFQTAVQTAIERASTWSRYLRTLPVSTAEILIYRTVASLFLGALAVSLVVVTGLLFTELKVTDIPWIPFLSSLFLGGIPFLILGLCIGHAVSARAAVPVANLVYLPLSFAGGLWMPPNILPKLIQDISTELPTRWYGEWVWNSLFIREIESVMLMKLLGFGLVGLVIFFGLSLREYSRE